VKLLTVCGNGFVYLTSAKGEGQCAGHRAKAATWYFGGEGWKDMVMGHGGLMRTGMGLQANSKQKHAWLHGFELPWGYYFLCRSATKWDGIGPSYTK
jgi:hypothetical protein